MNKPTKITVPNYVDTGQAIYISWSAVSGTDITYQLERSIDNSSYTIINVISNIDYTDIVLDGWNDVKYRVCAISGVEKSGYISSTNVACVYFKVDNKGKLQPFNFIVNFKESKIDVIPEIEDTTEIIAGNDGEEHIITRYEPRLFDLVCYTPSEKCYEVWQRDNLISMIGKAFHKLKNSERYLLYRNKLFKVKSGKKPEFDINPSWFEMQIAFKAYDPYGYSFENTAIGNCTVYNNGEEISKPIIFIEGVTSYPTFIINGISYQLKTNTAQTDTIEINCKDGTINNGDTNLLKYWESNFPILEIGANTIALPDNCKMVWKEKFIAV